MGVAVKTAREIPLAEVTLRKYEKPYKMTQRELVKKFLLSIGLLQPGDSRDIIVDIFDLLLIHKKGLPYARIEELLVKKRKKHKLPELGVTASNIHRQLRRLKEMQLIEKYLNLYRLSESMSLLEIFEEKIEEYYLNSIVKRVKEYAVALDAKKK